MNTTPTTVERRRVTLTNGRAVTVRVERAATAPPWTEADSAALRAILDIAAAAAEDVREPT